MNKFEETRDERKKGQEWMGNQICKCTQTVLLSTLFTVPWLKYLRLRLRVKWRKREKERESPSVRRLWFCILYKEKEELAAVTSIFYSSFHPSLANACLNSTIEPPKVPVESTWPNLHLTQSHCRFVHLFEFPAKRSQIQRQTCALFPSVTHSPIVAMRKVISRLNFHLI